MQLTEITAKIPPEMPVLIAGPTAAGKSALALAVAQAQGGTIINADALQVYDCWRVVTARPSPEDEARAPHRLYGHVGRDAAYSVGHWLRDVAEVLATGVRPIIVGGTGLYFSALTEGLAEIPPTPPAIRAEADARAKTLGAAVLLHDLDPATVARIDTRNPARVQRAWEVWRTTGRGLAAWQQDTAPPLLPLAAVSAWVFRPEKKWLDARINTRFDQMIALGALEEARRELPFWNSAHPSARAIGAPELMAHLRGETTLAEATEAAKLASRQYAKRQRTWFRNRMAAWAEVRPG